MVLAIITARANSKGLPGKNMIEIGQKPLIEYSFEIASRTSSFDKIVLSTDIDDAILLAKEKFSAIDIPFKRPDFLCGDKVSQQEVVNHVLNYYEQNNISFSHFILLQPTSLFRKIIEMEKGVELLKNGCSSVIGVSHILHHPADYLYKDNEGKIKFVMPEFAGRPRQEFPTIFFNNGAFYGCSVEFFKTEGVFYNEESTLLEMSDHSVVDIDTKFDLDIARGVLFQNNNIWKY